MTRGWRHPRHRGALIALSWWLLLPALPAAAAETLEYRIVGRYPHDPAAFTQGLLFHRGFLYESTGRYGQSTIRQVDIETGGTVRERPLPRRYFGEGLARWGDSLLQLTWRSGEGFVYGLDSLEKTGEFVYEGEGWGLTTGKRHLIMSDGSSQLRFLDPASLGESHRLEVTDDGVPLAQLNELEMVEGELFANILGQERIARIDPETGKVTGWLDLSQLRSSGGEWRRAADLNGIAWDEYSGRLFVTGKHWPRLYAIVLESDP